MRTSVTALLLLSTATLLPWSHGWSLFGAPASGNGLSLHPDSPAEADPISVRAKRQAYQVYVGGDASVSINKGGEAESGPWGPWTTERECSRTCGGGVLIEKRTCSGECTGPSVRYVSCNIEACESTTDFRAEQCAKNNDSPLHGVYYKWLPHVGKNKCELTCKPESGTFYYKWADKVVDGTRCDSIANDICVDGVCLPLGCDGKLGSSQKNDKCGVCGGDGSTCTTVEGIFDERNLSPGYHNVIVLPVGATNIRIEETRSTANHLAIKNSSDYFYLNGDHQIVVGDTNVDIAGTRFKYEAQKTGASERLTAAGPLTEEITVAILYDRTGGSNSAIEYEFSVPIEQDVPYLYKPGEWSQCSVTCGKGVQTRTPYCIDTLTQQRVEDNLCDEANSTKPDVEKDCVTVDCEAEWFEGDWEQCSESCGDLGLQYRVVYCHKVFSDGRRMTVDDANCTADRPEVKQSCNRFHCPEWHAGPWSACSEKCGDAKQYRSVTCRSEKIGEEGKLLPADQCNATLRFEPDRDCNLGPCEGLKFITTDWKLCEKCNDTEETRNVTCVDKTNRVYPIEKCLNENATEVPIDVRSCATVQPCVYEWHASEWSKCSTECGHGHKTRRVNCAIAELGQITVVDESLCQGEKPELKTNCTNEEKCTGTWFASPWSNCTAECAGGEQSRLVVCLNYDHEPVPEWCDEATKPAVDQECNVDPCPTCFDGEFGCCPDNITYALGEWSEGCSNCSLAEFGCCADNITEATGPNALGCLEYVEPEEIETTTLPEEVELIKSAKSSDANETDEAEVEGSGEDVKLIGAALQAGVDEEDEACNITVTSEDGKTAQVACALNTTLEENDEFLSNATEPENVTIHCSKTEFGCCPDWYTAAEGPDAAGCPEIELGACNDTLYGCCLDNVTLARGPNLEGCGDPACAASRFGCCKDRKTIGFGPHYLGCERSSFPCEISEFGCCPDGETAALGKNGTGCGANCLVTKYGCCPDGVTVAKGLQNEGCGCQFGQFGCCPDGKTPAKGASNYGCPNTCAQSQFGCCPDGKTPARGTNKEGCPCQYTRYGCCPDGETTALGPNSDGCDDCRYAKYGCCPDGESKALGPDYSGCPSTTVAPFLLGGTVAPAKILACSLPQDIGKVCNSGYKLQWFYDTTQGRCNQFWYGGCGGNDNRYATKEMCETICIEPPSTGRCYLPKIEGPPSCTDLVARYYYNHETKQCIAFWWRKCVQNANNFETFGECTAACQNADPITTTIAPVEIAYHVPTPGAAAPAAPAQPVVHSPQVSQAQPQVQVQDAGAGAPQVAGPVDPYAHLRNPQSADPYAHLRNQQQQPQQQQPQTAPVQTQPTTLVTRPQTSDPRAVCSLKKDVGRCTGHFPAFYYEVESASCKQFEYSGCGGNRNLFHTKEQCEDVCVARPQTASPVHHLPIRIGLAGAGRVGPALAGTSACDLPKDPGPCQNYTSQWYYNKADGTCNRFHYGGCEGNENRFGSSQHCIVTCGEHIDACELPPVEGPCNGNQLRYYYNREAGECQTFTYKGCLGNNNRFVTIEECQKRCKRQ